jgi:Ca-activated chloride channel family protein
MKKLISYLVLILIVNFTIEAQSNTITGKVTDETGQALPGVTVMEKNTLNGTVTDYNGNYSLSVSTADPVLVFNYIAYESEEIKVKGRGTINVKMTPSQMELQEVVVTGRSKKIPMLGSIVRGFRSAENDAFVPQFNTEGYATIHENGYKDVLHQPLSTFSIDVDRASYANVRRFLNMGQLPPKDAVRIEEMINYFNYDYPEPEDEHPFSVNTELSACPWNDDHQLLHVGLKGKEIDREELPASNLIFLIDVSGSMNSPHKLPLLKSSFELLLKQMRSQDRVAIVVYAGAAGLVLESTSGEHKEKILEAINKLSAGGSTAGGAGLKLAYKVAEENFIDEGNNRIILATDGDFNIGPSSNAEMERMIEKEREKGIYMTVLGFGMGNYKDDKMEIIADKGNGNYAYIDNIQEARKFMISEFAGSMYTIAKDVKFQIEFNPQRVKAYRLIGYENRLLNDEDFNDDKKDAGEMGAGHTVTALYEIIPAGSKETVADIDDLKYQKGKSDKKIDPDPDAELMTIKLRYKNPDSFNSILIERPIQGNVKSPSEVSDNYRFSAAVAGFGMLLRNSDYKNGMSVEEVLSLARSAKSDDEEGYRNEFIKLVKTADSLADFTASK